MSKARERYIYYPNTTEVSEGSALTTRNRSFAFRAEGEMKQFSIETHI